MPLGCITASVTPTVCHPPPVHEALERDQRAAKQLLGDQPAEAAGAGRGERLAQVGVVVDPAACWDRWPFTGLTKNG